MGLGFGWWLWGTFLGFLTKRFLCYLMYMSKPSLASAFILKVEALTSHKLVALTHTDLCNSADTNGKIFNN